MGSVRCFRDAERSPRRAARQTRQSARSESPRPDQREFRLGRHESAPRCRGRAVSPATGGPLRKLHHKVMVVDAAIVMGGSFNYTGPRTSTTTRLLRPRPQESGFGEGTTRGLPSLETGTVGGSTAGDESLIATNPPPSATMRRRRRSPMRMSSRDIACDCPVGARGSERVPASDCAPRRRSRRSNRATPTAATPTNVWLMNANSHPSPNPYPHHPASKPRKNSSQEISGRSTIHHRPNHMARTKPIAGMSTTRDIGISYDPSLHRATAVDHCWWALV